ncbi:MAG: hypothetical protein JOZ59_05550, partial [Candidatus Eremiobacteraeota bacterium]|nr:hypothetical protein [Candidatus Eremiobacteraeota bacterium]
MSKRSFSDRFDRYLLPLFGLILFLIATQVAIANLPSNKLFAGHDSGFYTLFPDQLIRTSAGTWEVKTALGFVNFQALVTLPFALLVIVINAFHFSGATVGRIFYELQILFCEFGTFWIAWLILERFYVESPRLIRALGAFLAALVATFNIFTAVLLMYPPSNFQMGVFLWPVVIGFELYLLWKRTRISTAILFGIVLTLATLGNPAHTMLGFALVAAIYIMNAIAMRSWQPRLVAAVVITFLATSVFFWLPAFASMFLYHGNVAAPVGANAAALTSSAELIKLRTTIAALLRFDGLLWWPKTRNADLYNSALMIFATYVPAALAIAALFARRWISRALWVLLLIGIELGKSAHPPFQLNLVALMTSFPLFAAFRQTYDKFALYIMLALPPLAAIGFVVVAAQRKYLWASLVTLVLVIVSIWPFVAGRAVDPYFLTNVPADYAKVDAIMGSDPQARVLSLPGGSNEIYIADWFKGGNFENLLFRTHALNSAIYKQRSISAAPLYDDFDLIQAQELPELISLLGVYGAQYVLLHKDFLTSYRMAFDFERYQVLGPLLARAMQRFLDRDSRLQKVYGGPSLVLYRVRQNDTLPHAFGAYDGGVALAYENTLLGIADTALMDPANHPTMLFAGNQIQLDDAQANLLMRHAHFVVKAPIIVETPALYREQVSVGGIQAQDAARRYWQLNVPNYFIFVQPHGDWLKGSLAGADNLVGTFDLQHAARLEPQLVLRATPMQLPAFRSYLGTEGDVPWPLRAFSDEPLADEIISEADLVDPDVPLAPGTKEPFVDPALSDLPVARAPATVTLDRTSATYHIRLQRGGEFEELVVARRAVPPISLLNDPKVSFDYDFSDPKIQAAWLRFEFVGPLGKRYFLDKQLDENGHLEGFDVRDTLQTGLDRRFAKLTALHQNDPQWFAQRSPFNPLQADRFRLLGLALIMGKPPFTDFSQTPDDVSLRFRGLQIDYVNPNPPAYPRAGYRVTFNSVKLQPQLKAIARLSKVSRSGAVLYTATTAPVRTPSSVAFKVPLPPLDLSRYPWLHLRFWQPVSNQELILKLGFITPSGTREVTPGLEVAPNAPPESAAP